MQNKAQIFESIKEVVSKLRVNSRWLFHMGLVYIGGAVTLIAMKAIQLVTVYGMHTIAKGNNVKTEDLNASFHAIYDDFVEKQDNNYWLNKFTNDVENKRAVLMGNGGTLKIVLVLNIVTGVLFLMQGLYMYTVVGTTKKTVEVIESRPIEECVDTLQS